MNYKIKFDDITSLQTSTQNTINSWGKSISLLNTAISDFNMDTSLKGQAISNIRTYLIEIHGTILQTLVHLMNDYSSSLLLYKDGYYKLDNNNHAQLPQITLKKIETDLRMSCGEFRNQIDLLNKSKSKISDLLNYSGNSHNKANILYDNLLNHVKNLDELIIQYEMNHYNYDLRDFKELLSATKALILEHKGKPRNVGTYQPGDIGKLKSIQRFATAYQNVEKRIRSNKEMVEAAQKRDQVRFESLEVEDRKNKGWIDIALGLVTFAVGVSAIVITGGAAIPLVGTAGLVAGIGTAVYGGFNTLEALHNVHLANKGDIKTLAFNPIKNIIFSGNDKLYHTVGGIFTTTSSVLITVGKAESLIKGVIEFTAGEIGGFVGGNTAYIGTKMLGGSEEDAQRATLVGGIIGGYAVSKVTEFSLNHIKNPKLSSFVYEISEENAKILLDEGISTPKTFIEFSRANPDQDIYDYINLVKNENPWPKGYTPKKVKLQPGTTLEMAMENIQPDDWPGGFATDIDTIKDVKYVRENLAVKRKWKDKIDRVAVYRVKEGVELPAQVGPIGPQIDLGLNKYLPGGPNQIEFLVPKEDRMKYLEFVGTRYIK